MTRMQAEKRYKMPANYPRIVREKKTIEVMVGMYCNKYHGTDDESCPDCSELLDYTASRLDKCPLQENKPTCAKCPIHCYKPSMREKVRSVMRYSGPRLILRHPVLALFHFTDSLRKKIN